MVRSAPIWLWYILTVMGLSFEARAALTQQPLAKTLFELMAVKCTNLALSADVLTMDELIHFADLLGPEICVLKTHIDIIEDFSLSAVKKLQQIADRHQFIIFEDRKFADIGQTVANQYGKGIYHIADWAHLVNAHILPGPGIIDGLKSVESKVERGLLLLAEMSSRDNFFTEQYRQQCFSLADQHKDFVCGFICQVGDRDRPEYIYMTPGVQLVEGGDQFGQQYRTPQQAIVEQQCDIIIVGRGITHDKNPLSMAKEYRNSAWKAYQGKKCNSLLRSVRKLC